MNDLTFTAIDFETANSERVSACSVGLCAVDKGIITETRNILIRPPQEACWFDSINVSIHGLTFDKVKNCDFFCGTWPQIEHMFKDRVLVAHNMPFDKSVLSSLMERYAIAPVHTGTLCTYRLSKRVFPDYENHKLDTVCRKTGVKMSGRHHDAESDAIACANILLCIAEEKKFRDISEAMAFLNLKQPSVKSPKSLKAAAAQPVGTLWKPGMGTVSAAAEKVTRPPEIFKDDELKDEIFGERSGIYVFDSELDRLAGRPGDGNDGLPTAKQLSFMKHLREKYSAVITSKDISTKYSATKWISDIIEKHKNSYCR